MLGLTENNIPGASLSDPLEITCSSCPSMVAFMSWYTDPSLVEETASDI